MTNIIEQHLDRKQMRQGSIRTVRKVEKEEEESS